MELLRDIAGDGYPTDYVVARVRARRTALTYDWRAAGARRPMPAVSDEAIWDGLLREFEWLYLQVDRPMRARLAPVFALFELKTIVLCLRNASAGRPDEIERLLGHSLLADRIRDALRASPDARAAIATVAAAASPVLGEVAALEDAYAQGGLKDVETRLVRRYLGHVVATRLAPPVRGFFTAFIDLRNLMMVYKRLRWEIEDEPSFIPGGSVGPARLHDGCAPGGFDALVREVVGHAAPPLAASETALETVLLGDLTRRLREAGKESGDIGLLLDYAWRLYVEARNRAVLLHAGALETATLERELIA
jgi:hypothetical protein